MNEKQRKEHTQKPKLFFLSVLQRHRPERALPNHHIRPFQWDLCRDEMTIDLSTDVAGVQNLQSGNFDHEHGGAEDVAGVVRGEMDSSGQVDRLMVVDRLDGGERGEDVRLGEQGVVCSVGPSERKGKELNECGVSREVL